MITTPVLVAATLLSCALVDLVVASTRRPTRSAARARPAVVLLHRSSTARPL